MEKVCRKLGSGLTDSLSRRTTSTLVAPPSKFLFGLEQLQPGRRPLPCRAVAVRRLVTCSSLILSHHLRPFTWSVIGVRLRLRVNFGTGLGELLCLLFYHSSSSAVYDFVFSQNSAIDFSPMSNAIGSDNLIGIIDFVNHTIVADTYPPIVFAAAKFSTTWRSRISRKTIYRADDSLVNRFG
jgi:hypothetical protein